jgi:hypothetical protein
MPARVALPRWGRDAMALGLPSYVDALGGGPPVLSWRAPPAARAPSHGHGVRRSGCAKKKLAHPGAGWQRPRSTIDVLKLQHIVQ